MIVTKLQGGIGNQLFQWAATYSAAKRNDCQYFFDLRYFTNKKTKGADRWDYELHKFNIEIDEFSQSVSLPVKYDNLTYQEIIPGNYLSGYWQSEKYFIDYKDKILKKLTKIKQRKILLEKYQILKENTVSLHVRRGDYLRVNPEGVLPLTYYHNALSYIDHKNYIVLVFSDDIQWCKENFQNYDNLMFIEEDNFNSLLLMSLCKNNIIANSSFSWWGAWMNDNINKIVVAPSYWLPKINTQEIVPNKWIKI